MRYATLLLTALALTVMSSFTPGKVLTITSTSFTNGGPIPSRYSCEGANTNPPLQVSGIPSGTQSLALIMHDPDAPMAGGFTHWVMWNINVNGTITENFKSAMQGLNGAQKIGYAGMCPPTGTHHYHFKVYALDTKLNLIVNADKTTLEDAMKGHILAEGDLVGLYKKMK